MADYGQPILACRQTGWRGRLPLLRHVPNDNPAAARGQSVARRPASAAAVQSPAMADVLEYGRRRSRRHWRVIAVAVVLGLAALFAVRVWRVHLARAQDLRLQAQQRAYRAQSERE